MRFALQYYKSKNPPSLLGKRSEGRGGGGGAARLPAAQVAEQGGGFLLASWVCVSAITHTDLLTETAWTHPRVQTHAYTHTYIQSFRRQECQLISKFECYCIKQKKNRFYVTLNTQRPSHKAQSTNIV